MSRKSRILACFAAMVAALCGAAQAQVASITSARVGEMTDPSGTIAESERSDAGLPLRSRAYLDEGDALTGYFAEAIATAGPGELGVYALSTVDATQNSIRNVDLFVQAEARATFLDRIHFSAPGPVSGVYTIEARLALTGDFGVHVHGAATARSRTISHSYVNVYTPALVGFPNVNGDTGYVYRRNDDPSRDVDDPIASFYDVAFRVRSGDAVPFLMQLETRTVVHVVLERGSSGMVAAGTAVASFGHTLSWAGITAVRDSRGNLVQDFALVAESGFEYGAAPVPEPAAIMMLVLGLGVIGLRAMSGRGVRVLHGGVPRTRA